MQQPPFTCAKTIMLQLYPNRKKIVSKHIPVCRLTISHFDGSSNLSIAQFAADFRTAMFLLEVFLFKQIMKSLSQSRFAGLGQASLPKLR
ncbi:hypothetical protein DQG23_07055 [Paenibacillus contaminans]|uniref:Uncharacterized protein n=1 Tax=Paenibacillus contaminans TaxID=450362 RepID=A0A329MQM5_9BACL|nr:hypothetical protein DQG23_07055 [Paenibacillus contaminans]